MNYDSRFMMNEGLVFLAYAYALSGYCPAAVLLGAAAVVSAVLFHSLKCLAKRGMDVLCLIAVQVPLLLVSGQSGRSETMALLAFCSAVVSVLWMESSQKAIRPCMRILAVSFVIFLYLALILPEEAALIVAKEALPKDCLIATVTRMFLPPIGAWGMRQMRKKQARVYNGSHSKEKYDRTADHTVYSGQQ